MEKSTYWGTMKEKLARISTKEKLTHRSLSQGKPSEMAQRWQYSSEKAREIYNPELFSQKESNSRNKEINPRKRAKARRKVYYRCCKKLAKRILISKMMTRAFRPRKMMNLMVTLSQKVSKMIGKANMPRRKLAGQRCSTMETIMNRMMRMIIARNNSRAQKMNHQKRKNPLPEKKSK